MDTKRANAKTLGVCHPTLGVNWLGANPKMLGVFCLALGANWSGTNPKVLGTFYLMLGINWSGIIPKTRGVSHLMPGVNWSGTNPKGLGAFFLMPGANWSGTNSKMLGVPHLALGIKWSGTNPKAMGVCHLRLGAKLAGGQLLNADAGHQPKLSIRNTTGSEFPVKSITEIENLRANSSLAWYFETKFEKLEKARVKGSLFAHRSAWRQRTSDPDSLEVVENGHFPPPPIHQVPPTLLPQEQPQCSG
ncbi:MAG: hypothetical protein GY832_36485 [Chloroflexi bacterium]|nr:hypothetical protein [Chloroflexota bacterium]